MVLRSLDGPFFAGLSEKRVLNVSKIGVLLTRCFAEEPCVVFKKKKPQTQAIKGKKLVRSWTPPAQSWRRRLHVQGVCCSPWTPCPTQALGLNERR